MNYFNKDIKDNIIFESNGLILFESNNKFLIQNGIRTPRYIDIDIEVKRIIYLILHWLNIYPGGEMENILVYMNILNIEVSLI